MSDGQTATKQIEDALGALAELANQAQKGDMSVEDIDSKAYLVREVICGSHLMSLLKRSRDFIEYCHQGPKTPAILTELNEMLEGAK